MLADEIPPDPDVRHERWLAMQSAYSDYTRASDALDCTHESVDGLPTGDRVRAMILEGRYRAAFERYMESRMAFLESEFDELRRPEELVALGVPQRPQVWGCEEKGGWRSLANSRVLLEALAIILLCTTAFSLVRTQKHIRDLEAARQEFETALQESRNGIQTLGQKVEKLGGVQLPATERVKNAPEGKPGSSRILRSSSLKSSADRKRKPLAAQHSQQSHALMKWYSSAGPEARRSKPPKSESATAPQATRGTPRNFWWPPSAMKSW